MAKSSTTITKENRDRIPGRGRSNKTIILEAMREASLVGLKPESTKEESEKAFFTTIAKSAFNPEDQNCGMCLKLLADKGWASVKPTSEMIAFDFNPDSELHEQASQVMHGVSKGEVPPDLGNNFVNGIANMLKIKEITDIDERLKDMEKKIDEAE